MEKIITTSPPQFFKDIYQSKPLTLLVTAILLMFTLPYIQIQFLGGAYLIEVASNGKIPGYIAGFIFYTIMVVYLWAGGLRAVALTDVFFGILIFITLLSTGFILASKAGHVDTIFSKLMTIDNNNVTLSGKSPYNSVYMWLAMFIITPLGAIMSPPIWIRNFSVKNEKTFYLIPFLITVAAAGYIGCFIAGNAGKVLEPCLTDPDTLIPTLLTKYCDKILMTFLLCGFAAASLSTANSQIHALSAIYTIDIHKEYINKNAKDAKLLYIAKWSVLVFSVIIYIIMVSNPSFIINTGLLALSGTAQILVPVLGALFWKRSTSAGAFAGLLAGIITIWFLYFTFHLESSYCGIIGIIINTLLFISVSRTTKQNPLTRAKIVNYYLEFENRHQSKN